METPLMKLGWLATTTTLTHEDTERAGGLRFGSNQTDRHTVKSSVVCGTVEDSGSSDTVA